MFRNNKVVSYLKYLKIFSYPFLLSLFNVLRFKLFYEKEKNIAFLELYEVHSSFTKPLIDKLIKTNRIVLFVSDKQYMNKLKENSNFKVFYVDEKYLILLEILEIPLLISPIAPLPKRCKPKNTNFMHLFHSIVSIHYIYGDDAFDLYDSFLAVGPHHIKELKRTEKIRGWDNKIYYKAGYPKIESLICTKDNKLDNTNKVILLAPSWGESNLLKSHGIEIINIILEKGYSIIVRPHPNSYLFDQETIETIEMVSKKNKKCILDNPNSNTMNSYLKSDIMISDYSGAAFEYAFGLLKPILFIDVPKKINKKSKEQLEYLPMEVTSRDEIGVVSTMKNFDYNFTSIITNYNWKEKIRIVRENYIYNTSNSIEVVIDIINREKNKKRDNYEK